MNAKIDIFHDCPECGGAINQILVGLGGEEKAQACIWSGGKSSYGWKTVEFSLNVPDKEGVYYARTRYAQAYGCKDALKTWKVDRPKGVSEKANIVYI